MASAASVFYIGGGERLSQQQELFQCTLQGQNACQSISDRTDYGLNPEKTKDGELTSAYACDPRSFAAEVLISKRQYKHFTGKDEKNDVLVYQVRQSFKPGEVTPEEANQIGYDFASRFLKGKHAFFVCTHTDKAHIHNHIYWNAVTLDCKKKFRDFRRSHRAVSRRVILYAQSISCR